MPRTTLRSSVRILRNVQQPDPVRPGPKAMNTGDPAALRVYVRRMLLRVSLFRRIVLAWVDNSSQRF